MIDVSTQCPSGSFVYTIRAGDTLFRLAQANNTTVNAILRINPGLNPNALQIGQRICIPGTAPVTCPSGSFSYVIRSGDTLFVLAQRFGTTVAAITALNPGIDPTGLRIGQTICIPGVPSPTCPSGSTAYTIQRGDTLFALAQRFGTTVPAILALNPGIDPNALEIGQRICIPGGPPPPVTCPTGSFAYVIRSGDTLFALAQRFGTTTAAIIALNPNINPNALQIGQTICIPQAVPTCPGGTLYTIQTGDTLFSLATRFNISVAELQMANPGLDPNRLMVGQRICIPSAQPITCPGNNTYVIEPGETLTSIAERFMVSTSEILILNPELRPGDFIPGRTICIPMNEA